MNYPALPLVRAGCVAIEEATADGGLDLPVPWCAGTAVAQVVTHLGVVHRLVRAWVLAGHRPVEVAPMPAGADVRAWFAAGWPPLLDTLSELDPATQTSTWCSYDTTAGFWWRRMAHETTIHAIDVLDAVGWTWPIPQEAALDGIDEALRLWLGCALGADVRGGGQVIRLVTPQTFWTVGLNETNVEVNQLPVAPDGVVRGDPGALYRWVWGRAMDNAVTVGGDRRAVAALRRALARSMQ